MITIKTTIDAPVAKVWQCWTDADHITHWNFASDDWHCPRASNDVTPGGTLNATMAAKDGSFSFDFVVVHDEVSLHNYIKSTMGDGRKMSVEFISLDEYHTEVVESFEPESENPVEMQETGWSMILANFKKHVESH
jgi:uncharacterized protein YndB with AHSA1/START domain